MLQADPVTGYPSTRPAASRCHAVCLCAGLRSSVTIGSSVTDTCALYSSDRCTSTAADVYSGSLTQCSVVNTGEVHSRARLKMHDLKMTDKVSKTNGFWKMSDELVMEYRDPENDGLENDSLY